MLKPESRQERTLLALFFAVGAILPVGAVIVAAVSVSPLIVRDIGISSTTKVDALVASGLIQQNTTEQVVSQAGTGLSIAGRALSLANTAVTAGSYTIANITVDAQGRLTAASSTTAPTFSGLVTTNGGLTNGSASTLEQAGDTWMDLATGAPVSLGAGLTSNWDPFSGGNKQSFVSVTPNAATTPGQISTTDSVIDGIVSDSRGSAPIAGALRVICQSALNHGDLVMLVAEGSVSSVQNKIYINADGNTSGTSMTLAHRQCVLQVYNPDRSAWQLVAAGDGVLRRFSISGYWSDTSLGASLTSYDAGGTAGTHLCGLTRLRWASAGATTVHNFVACNPGDVKQIQVFSGGITLKQNDTTGGGSPAPFFLPGSVDKVLVSGCTYWVQYDGPNAGYYIVMTSSTSGLAC